MTEAEGRPGGDGQDPEKMEKNTEKLRRHEAA